MYNVSICTFFMTYSSGIINILIHNVLWLINENKNSTETDVSSDPDNGGTGKNVIVRQQRCTWILKID